MMLNSTRDKTLGKLMHYCIRTNTVDHCCSVLPCFSEPFTREPNPSILHRIFIRLQLVFVATIFGITGSIEQSPYLTQICYISEAVDMTETNESANKAEASLIYQMLVNSWIVDER